MGDRQTLLPAPRGYTKIGHRNRGKRSACGGQAKEQAGSRGALGAGEDLSRWCGSGVGAAGVLRLRRGPGRAWRVTACRLAWLAVGGPEEQGRGLVREVPGLAVPQQVLQPCRLWTRAWGSTFPGVDAWSHVSCV